MYCDCSNARGSLISNIFNRNLDFLNVHSGSPSNWLYFELAKIGWFFFVCFFNKLAETIDLRLSSTNTLCQTRKTGWNLLEWNT